MCSGPAYLASNEENALKVMTITSNITLQKMAISILLTLSLWFFLFTHSNEVICYAVSCPVEKPMYQETKGRLWPTTSQELRSSVQQPVRHLNPANNHMSWKHILPHSSLRMKLQLQPTLWLQPGVRHAEPQAPDELHPESWPTITVR